MWRSLAVYRKNRASFMLSPSNWKISLICLRNSPSTAPRSTALHAATRSAGRSRSNARRAIPATAATVSSALCAKCLSLRATWMSQPAARRTRPRDGLLRHHLAAPDIDAVGLKRAIRLFDRTYDRDTRTGLQFALIARLVREDDGIRRHDDFLLPILVLNNHHTPVDAGNRLIDRAVCHRAVRPRVPRPMTLVQPSLRLRQDRHLYSPLAPVRLRSGADADKCTLLDVGDCCLGDTEHGGIGGEVDLHLTELFRFDRKHAAVEIADCAGNRYRGRLLRKRTRS